MSRRLKKPKGYEEPELELWFLSEEDEKQLKLAKSYYNFFDTLILELEKLAEEEGITEVMWGKEKR